MSIGNFANELTLFAINDGGLYQDHIALAEGKSNLAAWKEHVANAVVNSYCKQVEMVHPTPFVITKTAKALQDYYEEHIQE